MTVDPHYRARAVASRYHGHSKGVMRLISHSGYCDDGSFIMRKGSQEGAEWPVSDGGLQEPGRDDGAVKVDSTIALQVVQELGGRQPNHVIWETVF